MQIFIKDLDYELGGLSPKEIFMPAVEERDKTIPKPRSVFSKEETEKVAKNYRALNILFSGLDSNEFSRVSARETAKEV